MIVCDYTATVLGVAPTYESSEASACRNTLPHTHKQLHPNLRFAPIQRPRLFVENEPLPRPFACPVPPVTFSARLRFFFASKPTANFTLAVRIGPVDP